SPARGDERARSPTELARRHRHGAAPPALAPDRPRAVGSGRGHRPVGLAGRRAGAGRRVGRLSAGVDGTPPRPRVRPALLPGRGPPPPQLARVGADRPLLARATADRLRDLGPRDLAHRPPAASLAATPSDRRVPGALGAARDRARRGRAPAAPAP